MQRKAAGRVLTAKQAPHRPGTAPALGLRAGRAVVLSQTARYAKGCLVMCASASRRRRWLLAIALGAILAFLAASYLSQQNLQAQTGGNNGEDSRIRQG